MHVRVYRWCGAARASRLVSAMIVYRDRRGRQIPEEWWRSRIVADYAGVADTLVLSPCGHEIHLTTRWVGALERDEVTGIESGPMFWTEVLGGVHDVCVEHAGLAGALRFHRRAVAALREGRSPPRARPE